MYKVLIADKLSNEALAIFKENGIEAITKTDLDTKSLIKELQDCDGLVVRSLVSKGLIFLFALWQ